MGAIKVLVPVYVSPERIVVPRPVAGRALCLAVVGGLVSPTGEIYVTDNPFHSSYGVVVEAGGVEGLAPLRGLFVYAPCSRSDELYAPELSVRWADKWSLSIREALVSADEAKKIAQALVEELRRHGIEAGRDIAASLERYLRIRMLRYLA